MRSFSLQRTLKSDPQPMHPQKGRLLRPSTALLLATIAAFLIVAPAFQKVLWPLTWVALVPVLLTLHDVSPGRAFLAGGRKL
jgi:hypothetical protein